MTTPRYTIEQRRRRLINTDPLRRCYNGAHFSSKLVWSAWEVLESDIPSTSLQTRLAFWKSLNDYAVSQRGEHATAEFRFYHHKE